MNYKKTDWYGSSYFRINVKWWTLRKTSITIYKDNDKCGNRFAQYWQMSDPTGLLTINIIREGSEVTEICMNYNWCWQTWLQIPLQLTRHIKFPTASKAIIQRTIHNFRDWCCHLVKKLNSGPTGHITLEVVPFCMYAPFPVLLPFSKMHPGNL
jgi:hypothetical protein